MAKIFFLFIFLIVDVSHFSQGLGFSQNLAIEKSEAGRPYLAFNKKFVYGFGPSPQHLLTYLPKGNGNNANHWLEWAKRFRFTHVRSYPPSFIVKAPAFNVFRRSTDDSNKFDLTKFNQEYFDELHRVCSKFREAGIVVHLQLWQAVNWKRDWSLSYYNPNNNINPTISRNAGPGEFVTLKNPALLEHQKHYIAKILEATGNLGNVFYDVMNEIGNGTGYDDHWVLAITDFMRNWEAENKVNLLLTINDEGRGELPNIEKIYTEMDLLIKDLGRYDEHVQTQTQYNKPTISVRNIDWNYTTGEREYFYGEKNLEINENPLLHVRGRKYWWRMFMAKVQLAGAYADDYEYTAVIPGRRSIKHALDTLGIPSWENARSYDVNQQTETTFTHFINFISKIDNYPDLQPNEGLVKDHASAHSYILQSTEQVILYLESPNGQAGFPYKEQTAQITELSLADGQYSGYFYFPANGTTLDTSLSMSNGNTTIVIPSFEDDLALHIHKPK